MVYIFQAHIMKVMVMNYKHQNLINAYIILFMKCQMVR